jgi:hypothetical protein
MKSFYIVRARLSWYTQKPMVDSKRMYLLFLFAQSFYSAQAFSSSLDLNQYTPACKQAALRSLGWQIETSNSTDISPNILTTISRPTVDRSCSNNGAAPTLILPGVQPNLADAILNKSLMSMGTQCVFQHQFNQSIETSAKILKTNHLYFFPGPIGRFVLGPGDAKLQHLSSSWSQKTCENTDGNGDSNKCFVPNDHQIHGALVDLQRGLMEADCLTGLELVEYSALEQLFGDKKIEKYFTSENFYVGSNYYSSGSILGQNSRAIEDWYGLIRAQSGPNAFIGAPGILLNTKGDKYLDDADNKGENFVITEMTQNAVTALRSHGGLPGYDSLLNEIWQRSQDLTSFQIRQLEVDEIAGGKLTPEDLPLPLGVDPQAAIYLATHPLKDENFNKLIQILNDPFLSETKVYVHPVGFRSLAWHILRVSRLNSRTPYKLGFYPDTIHGEIFDRWLKMNLDSCN